MILTEKQRIEFEVATRPMMKFLADNFHPHVSVLTDSTRAQLVEGIASVVTQEFIHD